MLNLGQLIELMAIVSVHSPNLVERSEPLPEQALERYLYWSELRAAEWLSTLEALPGQIAEASAVQRGALWNSSQPTFVDIFAGGLVARVWGAVLTACDRKRKTFAAERTGRTVLAGQDRAQQRLLRLMVDGPCLSLERVVALDRIRRKIERWSDLLVGHIIRRYALADFAYDADRALDFGEEQLQHDRGLRHDQIWDMYFLCLRSTFPELALPGGIHADRRDEVLKSILNCLPESLFLEDGMMLSVELNRILAGAPAEGPPGDGALDALFIRWPDAVRRIDRRRERRGWNIQD